MKKLGISYFLCILSFFGVAGLHRFYLGRPASGFLYLITGGFLGIASFMDMCRMQTLVDAANYRLLTQKNNENFLNTASHNGKFTNPERQILITAKNHRGLVTPQIVTMESDFSLREARHELEKLRKENFCTLDIDEDGAEIYHFHGLTPKEPVLHV